MKLSAIMPIYNQASYVDEALASIVPQVSRLVIVDDGSTDATAGIIYHWSQRESKIEICSLRNNVGTAKAINYGFRWLESDGPAPQWVTWVSGDNRYASDWAASLEEAGDHDGIGVVYSGYTRKGADLSGEGSYIYQPYSQDKLISTEACFFGPSFAIRYRVWRDTGDHRGAISHDYDHWLRIEETCLRDGWKIVSVDRSLCDYRVHRMRRTVLERKTYDAPRWQVAARARRRAQRR